MEQNKTLKRLLLWGMLGAISTMIGDFLLLGVSAAGATGALGQYLLAAEKLSYLRIGLAGFFGFVGIPVTAFGFEALYRLTKDKTTTLARWYRASVYGYVAFGGAIHIICCYLVTGMKKALETGTDPDAMLSVLLAEQGGCLVPSMVVFLVVYLVHVVTFVLLLAKGRTALPKWMWVLNPLTFKILLNAVSKLGTSAFLKGIGCSNMSLGSLIIFTVWMIWLAKNRKGEEYGRTDRH